MSYHIAVFDIGKTNKKLVIYDHNLNIVRIEKTQIEEYSDDRFSYDNVPAIEQWILDMLKNSAPHFNIRVISISAHGATFTCVDENGDLAVPELSYTTDPGEGFHDAFFEEMGSEKTLQMETCTPDFKVLLNVAKGIKFAKATFSDQFGQVKHVLNYPQHFSYKLTGVASADPTYVGCHSYLWDFRKNTWSHVVDKLNIRPLLPEKLSKSWDIIGNIRTDVSVYTGLPSDTKVITGIHDSNASLLPHIITSNGQDFILNSTGTWCVLMHQMDAIHFNPEELGKVVFYNLSVFNKPVKTAIFMGGLEFEAYESLLSSKGSENCRFHPEIYRRILDQKKFFILPGITKGTGQFPESTARVVENDRIIPFEDISGEKSWPDFFDDSLTAFAVLNLSLAIQTMISLERVGMRNGLPIYTEGGFSNNEAYNMLTGAFYPESDLFLTDLREATACGAALLGKAALERKHPGNFKDFLEIKKKPVKKITLKGLKEYTQKFLDLI